MTAPEPADVADDGLEPTALVWPVFGDLMAGVLGAFVLILVFSLALQLDLADRLQAEVRQRQLETQRREALEQALAGPLATGRVTFTDGRVGISGSVLFAFNSAQLQPDGRLLLDSLAGPLAAYLAGRDDALMVSGFTDDRAVRSGGHDAPFADNWELSAQRALTVVRTLVDAGVPASAIFAAAFGEHQPVASNDDAAGRARNRRVELAPVPRPPRAAPGAPPPAAPAAASGRS